MNTESNSGQSNHEFFKSRRSFLATTAGAAAAAALASSVGRAMAKPAPIARWDDQPVGKAKGRVALKDGEPIRVGVIGIGGEPGACAMGLGHCESLTKNIAAKGRENVQVVAVCDLNKHYVEQGKSKLAKWQPGVKVDGYAKSAELLARGDIHGVVVATPEHWHSMSGIEAILAGKDLYLEKPMCLNLEMAIEDMCPYDYGSVLESSINTRGEGKGVAIRRYGFPRNPKLIDAIKPYL